MEDSETFDFEYPYGNAGKEQQQQDQEQGLAVSAVDVFRSDVAVVKRDAGKVVDGRVVRCIPGNVRPVSVVDVYERITQLLFRLHFVSAYM